MPSKPPKFGATSSKAPAWQHRTGKASRHARGYGTAWDRLRETTMLRDLRLCQQCKREGALRPAHSVDHITPKSEGGTDAEDNLEALCKPCHMEKTRLESCRARGVREPAPRRKIGPDGWPA